MAEGWTKERHEEETHCFWPGLGGATAPHVFWGVGEIRQRDTIKPVSFLHSYKNLKRTR